MIRRLAARRVGGEQGFEEREPEGRLNRRGPKLRVDAFEDRVQRHQLARRVQGEQVVDQGGVLGRDRKSIVEQAPLAGLRVDLDRAGTVGLVGRGGAQLPATELIAADRAAVPLADRRRWRGGRAGRAGHAGRAHARAPRPARADAARGPFGACQTSSSRTTVRPHVAHEVANRSLSAARSVVWPCGAVAMTWKAASRWRRSGGRSTTSARSRVSGAISKLTAWRPRSSAARAVQPPRPNGSRTASPTVVCASIRASRTSPRGGGASRSNAGSESRSAGAAWWVPAMSRDSARRARCGAAFRGRVPPAVPEWATSGPRCDAASQLRYGRSVHPECEPTSTPRKLGVKAAWDTASGMERSSSRSRRSAPRRRRASPAIARLRRSPHCSDARSETGVGHTA